MPLPVDIDVGEPTPQHPAPQRPAHLQPVKAGRPGQRAAEDAWVAPHRQEVPQPPERLRSLGTSTRISRADELPFWAYLVGMASIIAMVIGFAVLLVGAATEAGPLVRFGAWTVVSGVAGFVLLVLRSDRL